MAKTVEQQLDLILADYNRDVIRATNEAFESVGKSSVQELKNTSPKRKGKYARSWTMTTEKGGGLKCNTVVIHNKMYQLTHLLENGHIIRNAKGTYGRTSPQKHIAPVEESAAEELPDAIKRKL